MLQVILTIHLRKHLKEYRFLLAQDATFQPSFGVCVIVCLYDACARTYTLL